MLQRGDFGPPFFSARRRPWQAAIVRAFTESFHNVTNISQSNCGSWRDTPELFEIFSKIHFFSSSPIHTASRLIILAYHFASPDMQGIKVVFPMLADFFFFQ